MPTTRTKPRPRHNRPPSYPIPEALRELAIRRKAEAGISIQRTIADAAEFAVANRAAWAGR